jgi:hypothetical protein
MIRVGQGGERGTEAQAGQRRGDGEQRSGRAERGVGQRRGHQQIPERGGPERPERGTPPGRGLWPASGPDGWPGGLPADGDGAARIAGYHLTALTLIAADPDASHERQSLLSAEELRFSLEGLAGPHRERPGQRMHELFERRVRAQPDAVAASCGDRQWTYAAKGSSRW